MLEVLTFILSGFWIWLGTIILIAVIGSSASNIVRSIRGHNDIEEI